jgi:Flp pilus assembly protein TadD
LRKAERFEEAVPHYRRSLELRPDHPEALFDLGVCLEQLSRPDEAVQVYQRYINAVRARDPASATRVEDRIRSLGGGR